VTATGGYGRGLRLCLKLRDWARASGFARMDAKAAARELLILPFSLIPGYLTNADCDAVVAMMGW